jgi:hypothetical protein
LFSFARAQVPLDIRPHSVYTEEADIWRVIG